VRIRVPGDKSLSQRALILSALGRGTSRLKGLLCSGDTESTLRALRGLGVRVPNIPRDGSEVLIEGVGLDGLETPDDALDLGNSGTGARLLLGVLAGSNLSATIDGDASLRMRPMARVTKPLELMGARFQPLGGVGRLPVTVHGNSKLKPLEWSSPVASGQIKSSLLFAGLTGRARTVLTEPLESRDHTERMFNAVGASVIGRETDAGWRVEMPHPPDEIGPLDFTVPGDISSAAFVMTLVALGGAGTEVTIQSVGLNRTRTAFLDVLSRMGVDIEVHDRTPEGSIEPVGDLVVRPGGLLATSVGAVEIPCLIDELPLVAVLGACAEGETRIAGAQELRVKESDRILTVTENLRALGVVAEELDDGLIVQGLPGRKLSGRVSAFGDHRIAMSFSVLARATGGSIDVDDARVSDVSFPGFDQLIQKLTEQV
jgi:3-phosphoshikimate 1-carboxyvinyltransferase